MRTIREQCLQQIVVDSCDATKPGADREPISPILLMSGSRLRPKASVKHFWQQRFNWRLVNSVWSVGAQERAEYEHLWEEYRRRQAISCARSGSAHRCFYHSYAIAFRNAGRHLRNRSPSRRPKPSPEGELVELSMARVRTFGLVKWVLGEQCGIAFDAKLDCEDVDLLREHVESVKGLPPEIKAAYDNWMIGAGR